MITVPRRASDWLSLRLKWVGEVGTGSISIARDAGWVQRGSSMQEGASATGRWWVTRFRGVGLRVSY